MAKVKSRRIFEGMDLLQLEANTEIFKAELGDRFINESILSHNPKWVIEVEFWVGKE